MRKEPNNNCRIALTWIPEGKRLDERIGTRYKSQRLTELVGGVVLRPFVPHGTKWIGEGEKRRYMRLLCAPSSELLRRSSIELIPSED